MHKTQNQTYSFPEPRSNTLKHKKCATRHCAEPKTEHIRGMSEIRWMRCRKCSSCVSLHSRSSVTRTTNNNGPANFPVHQTSSQLRALGRLCTTTNNESSNDHSCAPPGRLGNADFGLSAPYRTESVSREYIPGMDDVSVMWSPLESKDDIQVKMGLIIDQPQLTPPCPGCASTTRLQQMTNKTETFFGCSRCSRVQQLSLWRSRRWCWTPIQSDRNRASQC